MATQTVQQMFVGGDWQPSATGETFEATSPATGAYSRAAAATGSGHGQSRNGSCSQSQAPAAPSAMWATPWITPSR